MQMHKGDKLIDIAAPISETVGAFPMPPKTSERANVRVACLCLHNLWSTTLKTGQGVGSLCSEKKEISMYTFRVR